MNPTILQTPLIRNEKKWYLLSIFYAREKWDELIINIMNFYRMHTGLFSDYLFSLSALNGEHLQVTFASFDIGKDYTKDIQSYFQSFLEQCPSNSSIQFPYGKVIWGNYPNNTLTWNRFRLPIYSDQYICFHQQTMRVALNLFDNDFSEENIFSIGLYLITKGLECVNITEQKSALIKILGEAALDSSNDMNLIKDTLFKMNINEICEAIESYRNEDTSEYSPELIEWLNQTRNYLNTVSFNVICHFICKVTGLTGFSHIIIIEILYENFYNE